MNYSEEGVQYHLNIRKGDVGRYVLLSEGLKRCEKIVAYLDDMVLAVDSKEYAIYTGYLDGEKVSVTSTGIGDSSALIAMEGLVKSGADIFIRVETYGGMGLDVKGGDTVVSTGTIRMEGTSEEYAPIEHPAVAGSEVNHVLVEAAKRLGQTHYTGVMGYKDAFHDRYKPETKPVGYEPMSKWEARPRLGCKASGMKSAALFVVANYLRVYCGSNSLVVANQEGGKTGLDNPVVHDTDVAIKVAMEVLRAPVQEDKAKQRRRGVGMDRQEILERVDHTLLVQTATWQEIKEICDGAAIYNTASVCIPPSYVRRAVEYSGERIPVCTVIGFPSGYNTTGVECFETADAVAGGTKETDMAMNLGWMKEGRYDLVKDEVQQIKKACGGRLLKVIIEVCPLTGAEKKELCRVVMKSDAEYIKTSTSFSTGDAIFKDVELMRKYIGADKVVKTVGDVKDFADAERFMEFEANRLGISRLVEIMKK